VCGAQGGESGEESLRDMLVAVAEFLREVREPLKDLLGMVLEVIEGDRVGRDVASFYRRLVEAGVPDDIVRELTVEYFRKRMERAIQIPAVLQAQGLPGTLQEKVQEEGDEGGQEDLEGEASP